MNCAQRTNMNKKHHHHFVARSAATLAAVTMLSLSGCSAIVGVGGIGASFKNTMASKRGEAATSTCPKLAASFGTVLDLVLAGYIAYDADKRGVQTGHYVAGAFLAADAIAGVYLTQLFCE